MKRSETICARCGKNPRAPYSKNCDPCREEVKKEHQQNHIIRQRKTRAQRKQHIPCICGCGKSTVYPTRYATEECRAKGKLAALARNAAHKKEERAKKMVEPVLRPLSDKEIAAKKAKQERLDAEASARDRAWHARFMKEKLGLESPAPGMPLASKVVTPPVEIWREYEAQYKPQTERHARDFWLPEITY